MVESKNIIDHLEEVRKRLFYIGIVIIGIAIISFSFADKIKEFLLKPSQSLELVFLTPPEAFMAYIRLSFITAAVIGLPFIVYQILIFFFPALHRQERRWAILFSFLSLLLFVGGITFGYLIVFPFTIRFFLGFATEDLQPYFTISHFLSFAVRLHMAFGLVFLTPLVFWFLGSMGIVQPAFLRKQRIYALIIIVILAAIITPPDFISQILIALPLILLYEVGIWLVVLAQRKK